MEALLTKFRRLNDRWNDLPRRGMIVLVTCLVLLIALKLFGLFAPLIVALVFSWIITPLSKPLEKGLTRIKLPKRVGSMIAVTLVFGLLIGLLIMLVTALTREAGDLVNALPGFADKLTAQMTEFVDYSTEVIQDQIGDEALRGLFDVFKSLLASLSETVSTTAAGLVSFTWSAVTTLPDILMIVIFTIMESYYLVADRHDISGFISRWLPERMNDGFDKVKNAMVLGIRAQVITAIVEMFAAAVVLLVGFLLIGVDYALIYAVVISVIDALPVIGAGLIMFPMAIYYAIFGDPMTALGVIVLYFVVLIVKRVIEPRLLGKQMKLNQLATLAVMFACYRVMGFLGIIVGPILLMLIKVILEAVPPRSTDTPADTLNAAPEDKD